MLQPGKERSLLRRHPWVFSHAIGRVDGSRDERARLGATALLQSAEGQFLGYAAHSPHSRIRARLWTKDSGETIDAAFFRRRIDRALACRRAGIGEREGLAKVSGLLAGAEPTAEVLARYSTASATRGTFRWRGCKVAPRK